MNRRQFVKDSLVTSLSGLAGGNLLSSPRYLAAESRELPALAQEPAGKHRVYAHLLDPREHPDYTRRHVRPPTWDTFEGRTHLAALRGFKIEDSRIVDYVEKIEKYTQKSELGDVLWPICTILYTENLGDLLDEMKRRKLFLFDVFFSGFAINPGPGPVWQALEPPPGVFGLLEEKLGARWLGMDNGEQDGRYIGGFASRFYPSSADRLEQHLNFQRHFERHTDTLGNKMATLVSLNYGHYYLKEGIYTLIGAETAQGLPNGQVYYVFIRGAGKQYGVPWFGNASVYNRWGWKTYSPLVSRESGPTKGSSLSLLKRLMYSQILYNSVLVCFENCWFYFKQDPANAAAEIEGDELSPIGQIQRAAGRWIREAGRPGAMLTPIALMVDFFAGWTFPRHCYSSDLYRVWGNLPFKPGDYLTDGVLDMLYPGYQDSSYFHDESGFVTATPYGDAADCLLSDAPGWLLARYPVLVVAGGLEGGAEIRDKFEAYVKGGGHLFITAGNLAKLPGGLAGIEVETGLKHFEAGKSVQVSGTRLVEDNPFDLCALTLPGAARVLAESSGAPAAVGMAHGEGRITIFASPFGVSAKEANSTGLVLPDKVQNLPWAIAGHAIEKESQPQIDKPLAKPYPLLKHVRAILDEAFRAQRLFEVGDGLSLITCRKGPGEYTLGVSNNTWRQQPLKIVSHCGRIESLRELALDQAEKGAVGYLPEGLEKTNLGVSDEGHIAGGDIRIFAVRVREENVEEIAHVVPAARPRGRALPLREARSIKEEVLARPSFFEHFDGVVVDWRYLREREKKELERESGWIDRQGLKLLVDLTSGINLFPDLCLLDNLVNQDYAASLAAIEDVMEKMEFLHARDLLLALHRYPQNNFTLEQIWQAFEATLRHLCERGRREELTLHLRLRASTPPENLAQAVEFVGKVGAPNLRLAPSTALLLAKKVDLNQATTLLKGRVGLWLVSTPQVDISGRVWNPNAPVWGYQDTHSLAKILAIAPEAPMVFDALYKNHDEEYLDAKSLQEMLGQRCT
jgi:hypothetical protein